MSTHWRTRLRFTDANLDAIEVAVARAEGTHAGQIRFAIETALHPMQIWRGVTPRERAVEVFSALHVWDTEHNNGVLIYVQLADRVVEIIADRGIHGRVSTTEWEAVCRLMEDHFRAGRFREGAVAGVEAVGMLLSRHYPAAATGTDAASDRDNELPDRPALL
ncbi:MAG: TPM domain-containing protein [Steroidobacteraceae bacterium]